MKVNWEELKKKDAELYKCKTIDFVWYDVMNELCGSNIAIGFYATRDNLEDPSS